VIIHDLLRGIVQPERIRGFLVFNAHKLSDSSIESFILRVFKKGNPNGFIKVSPVELVTICLSHLLSLEAFTDNADALCRGFGKVSSSLSLSFDLLCALSSSQRCSSFMFKSYFFGRDSIP
jgi:hypothetical protein